MKIVDNRKSDDRFIQGRGVEIYPFIERDNTLPVFEGSIQVFRNVYFESDTGYSEQNISVRINIETHNMTIEGTQKFLLALSTAYGIAEQWNLEEGDD